MKDIYLDFMKMYRSNFIKENLKNVAFIYIYSVVSKNYTFKVKQAFN